MPRYTVIFKSDNLGTQQRYQEIGVASSLPQAADLRRCNGDLVYEGDKICTQEGWLFPNRDLETYALRMMRGEAPKLSEMLRLK